MAARPTLRSGANACRPAVPAGLLERMARQHTLRAARYVATHGKSARRSIGHCRKRGKVYWGC